VIFSALRNIQFILETQGCSLDSAMIVILKSIFKNYPDRAKQDKLTKRERELRQKMNYDKDLAEGNTLLASHLRGGGIHGTGSANELGGQYSSAHDMQSIGRFQLNQNSEREALAVEQLRAEPRNSQKMSMIESLFSLSWV